MRPLAASNRAIISQLIASFGNASSQENARTVPRLFSTHVARLLRFTSLRELRHVTLVAFVVAGLAAGLLAPWMGVLVLFVAVLGLWIKVSRRSRARRSAIERDIPALLTAVASSVRAGVDPLRAIIDAEEYFPPDSPLVYEVRAFKHRLSSGEDETWVVEQFLENDQNRDAELFKQCVLLSRKHGSSLSEPLHRVVRVARQHQSFKRKTRAALAMHQMSAFGIMLCAVFTGVLQVMMNPEGIRAALADSRGVVLLSIGGALIALGVLWMMHMGREEVV
jgi:Flp pilus assembly protein TadB